MEKSGQKPRRWQLNWNPSELSSCPMLMLMMILMMIMMMMMMMMMMTTKLSIDDDDGGVSTADFYHMLKRSTRLI